METSRTSESPFWTFSYLHKVACWEYVGSSGAQAILVTTIHQKYLEAAPPSSLHT